MKHLEYFEEEQLLELEDVLTEFFEDNNITKKKVMFESRLGEKIFIEFYPNTGYIHIGYTSISKSDNFRTKTNEAKKSGIQYDPVIHVPNPLILDLEVWLCSQRLVQINV